MRDLLNKAYIVQIYNTDNITIGVLMFTVK